jgi:hypothetical protein
MEDVLTALAIAVYRRTKKYLMKNRSDLEIHFTKRESGLPVILVIKKNRNEICDEYIQGCYSIELEFFTDPDLEFVVIVDVFKPTIPNMKSKKEMEMVRGIFSEYLFYSWDHPDLDIVSTFLSIIEDRMSDDKFVLINMKIRLGFVSNSSASSFIIKKNMLDKRQIKALHNHVYHHLKKLGGKQTYKVEKQVLEESWRILEDDEHVRGWTWMTNFDMREFMKKIGVDVDKDVRFSDENGKWVDDVVFNDVKREREKNEQKK